MAVTGQSSLWWSMSPGIRSSQVESGEIFCLREKNRQKDPGDNLHGSRQAVGWVFTSIGEIGFSSNLPPVLTLEVSGIQQKSLYLTRSTANTQWPGKVPIFSIRQL